MSVETNHEEGRAGTDGGSMFIDLDNDYVGQDVGWELVSEREFPSNMDLCYQSQEDFLWETVDLGEFVTAQWPREVAKTGPRVGSRLSLDWMVHTQGLNIMEVSTLQRDGWDNAFASITALEKQRLGAEEWQKGSVTDPQKQTQ
ncbi:hypothetical protein NDU88_006241 [Pleurodeles waltl]|uniref:Uncharacterized protein n=1 Tax=Pleurodeles waltl TaxID=8319 RepID=A0AAV7LNM1_PLEWA|nr:hypothetical protein NDU88_006241 [Pleurodeles waltl]